MESASALAKEPISRRHDPAHRWDDAQQQTERVDEHMAAAARDFLSNVITLAVERIAPFLSAPGALAVDDRRRRAHLASGRFARRDIEGLVRPRQRAGAVEQDEIVLHCTLGR